MSDAQKTGIPVFNFENEGMQSMAIRYETARQQQGFSKLTRDRARFLQDTLLFSALFVALVTLSAVAWHEAGSLKAIDAFVLVGLAFGFLMTIPASFVSLAQFLRCNDEVMGGADGYTRSELEVVRNPFNRFVWQLYNRFHIKLLMKSILTHAEFVASDDVLSDEEAEALKRLHKQAETLELQVAEEMLVVRGPIDTWYFEGANRLYFEMTLNIFAERYDADHIARRALLLADESADITMEFLFSELNQAFKDKAPPSRCLEILNQAIL